jgi:predicted transposase YbfD/YdcC
LRRFLTLKHGIPSQDTFERIFEIIQPQAWQRLFLDWTGQLPLPALPEGEREMVAIDGKTSRGSASPGLKALHTVNVFSVQHNVVLSAAGVPEKTNEVTVLPELIRVIAPVGAIITTDAMGCQKEVARAVREVPGADYLLAVKKNHPKLEAEIDWLFRHHDQDVWREADSSLAMTHNTGHGRTETRECRLMRDLTVLEQAREWKDLHAVARVRATRTIGDKTSVEDRFYLTSLQGEAGERPSVLMGAALAKTALHASRLHWGIENGLHWLLDVVFRDDASKIKLANARQNWVSLRHFALTLLRRPGAGKGSVEIKRFKAALEPDYLLSLLTLR